MTETMVEARGGQGASSAAWPSVSVVVPTRDRPEYLARALRALVGQDYEGEIECTVVFDRTEPSLPDIRPTTGREILAVSNDRSPGLTGARNTGALAATGELLAFCDDDDEWLPNKLRRQVETLRSSPEAVLVGSGIFLHYGGRVFTRVPDVDRITFRDLLLSRRMEIHSSNILVRRADYLGRIGPVDESLPGSQAEDYEWLLRATRLGPAAVVREPLVRIHWHRSSFFQERWDSLAAALTDLLGRYPEFAEDRRGHARICGQIAFAHAAAGKRDLAWRWVRRTFGIDWRERRTYLSVAVALGVPANRVLQLAHMTGKGI
jgi:glycosyltransferase involved in cell wall biosynthesis